MVWLYFPGLLARAWPRAGAAIHDLSSYKSESREPLQRQLPSEDEGGGSGLSGGMCPRKATGKQKEERG